MIPTVTNLSSQVVSIGVNLNFNTEGKRCYIVALNESHANKQTNKKITPKRYERGNKDKHNKCVTTASTFCHFQSDGEIH